MSVPIAPAVTPVGHRGAGVQISERRAWSVTGWLGVVLVIGCGYLVRLSSTEATGWVWLPLLVGIAHALSLVVVPQPASPIVNTGSLY